jgi:flavin reductase (DIM6/NTAB) family NADH-FMN oxidoreductase RutF
VVRHVLRLGSHDLFIGEVVAVHAEEGCLDARGAWDMAKLQPLTYCHGEYWNLGQMVGKGALSKRG